MARRATGDRRALTSVMPAQAGIHEQRRWGPPQPLTPNTHNDVRPHPVLVPGSGVWVLWTSDRLGDPDVVARQVVTAI